MYGGGAGGGYPNGAPHGHPGGGPQGYPHQGYPQQGYGAPQGYYMQPGMQGMQPGMQGMPMQGMPMQQGYGAGPMQGGMPMQGGYGMPVACQGQGYGMQGGMGQPQAMHPPTDEEQEWLEQQMAQEMAKQQQHDMPPEPEEPSLEDLPVELQAGASSVTMVAPAGDSGGQEGYEDVMKMIEENRRKNEARRAEQSARNAEIIAAFEARGRS